MTAREVRKLRDRLDMTQEEFARKLDVAHLTIVRWENKMAKPSRKSTKKLTNLEKEIGELEIKNV